MDRIGESLQEGLGEQLETVDLGRSDDGKGGPGARASATAPRSPQWSNFFLVLPVLAVSYVAHTRYRRYSPRRLPTLTSMRVHEIYGYLAVEAIASGVNDELRREVLDDPDLWLLELTARSLKESDSDRRWTKVADPFIDPTIKEKLRGTRNDAYQASPGVWGKLTWWHNHIWSSEETWIRAAIVSHFKLGIDVVSPPTLADYDRWITHIANTFQAEDSEFGEGYGDYETKALIPFAVSVPFAMAARWAARRSLFRPVNGLQRLLMWAALYPDLMQAHQHYAYLRGFGNKQRLAQSIRDKLGLDANNKPLVK